MLSVISIEEPDKWDSIVTSFKDYDVNYLSGYADAFKIQGEGKPQLFYYKYGGTRAMNVVMLRDIAACDFFKGAISDNTWFDISTPYGYGGFWIEGDDHKGVHQSYDAFCKENGYVSEFVRFHLFSNAQRAYNGSITTHTHNIVRSLELSLDDMMMDFEHKVRKNLKKASRADLRVELDYSGKRLSDFLQIYYGTMDRTNAKESFYFPEDFFLTLTDNLANHYVFVHVIHDNKVISTELVLYGKENCYSFLGGTNRDFFHLRPNDFLKYEIIRWAKEKGLKRFVLGGGYGKDDGIFKYKRSFAPNGVYNFYVGNKVFDQEKYDTLMEIRQNEGFINTSGSFFPSYRAE